ncbi:sugar MFS transporter [Pedobacter heparinus]|uniref:sugar MFS transporter n=1 Tax=Pedobacter heparinus TaxID=984 RepID=UPI002931BAB0|nr:sugar MFS transporter [Pedobacter heparinus]
MNRIKSTGNQKQNDYRAIVIIGILFFIFGFISWINSVLIPYFKLACNLDNKEAMLVAFAFYISYFVMAFPASAVLKKTGLKNGMSLGLLTMAVGALIFIPAAWNRIYWLFLIGLFVQATGLTLLQIASNPYITVLGPIESAAKRISIMGICNKVAGAVAPLILIHAITKSPDEIDQLQKTLPSLSLQQQNAVLDALSNRLAIPYLIIAILLIALCIMISFSHLPDVEEIEENTDQKVIDTRTSVLKYPYLVYGAIAVFCSVSVEVLAIDSIINYAQHIGFSFKEAKFFATYTLIFMMATYLFGAFAIPKIISQKMALQYSAIIGLVLSLSSIFITGEISVWCIALLGFSNALLWPSIWPLAIDGLGKFTKQGSALMIMGVIGGAITPLIYGHLSDTVSPQKAYWVLIPCYLFIYFFAKKGSTIGKFQHKHIVQDPHHIHEEQFKKN